MAKDDVLYFNPKRLRHCGQRSVTGQDFELELERGLVEGLGVVEEFLLKDIS